MDFGYLEAVLSMVMALALFQVFGRFYRRKKKLPPGPFPLPFVGNIHLFLGDRPHQSLAKLSQIHGPIMSLQLGQVMTVVFSSPAMAKEVLQKQDSAFSSRSVLNSAHAMEHAKYSVGWLPVGSTWRSLRKMMNSNLFSSNRLDANRHLRRAKIQELIAYCNKCGQAGLAVDIGRAAFKTSLNLLSNTIFSKNFSDPFSDSSKDAELKELIWNYFEELGKPNLVDFFPVLEKMDPQGIRRRLTVYLGRLIQLFGGLIDERLEQRKLQGGPSHHDDMLDILLTTSEESAEDINRPHIEHLCVDLITAGADTTSATVEWAMAELLRNSGAMKRTQDELAQVIGRGKPLDEADIPSLPYLSCVVKEVLRLHPAGPLLVPRTVEQDAEVHGYMVPKGSRVIVNAWAIGRDPTVWEDPLTFKPERFWQSSIDVRGRDFELIPFGAGRRICPGLPLAYRMVPVTIGSLLNVFDWKLEKGMTPEQLNMEEKFGLTLQRASPVRAVPVPI